MPYWRQRFRRIRDRLISTRCPRPIRVLRIRLDVRVWADLLESGTRMSYKKTCSGDRFGMLVVMGFHHSDNGRYYECQCDCGKTTVAYGGHLRYGTTTSCGCYAEEVNKTKMITHGASKTPEFYAWQSMISRCHNPKVKCFPRYGGRGISVCAEWIESFVQFITDMGVRPSPQHSLERKDNNGNYEPTNCRWATMVEQGVNKSSNRFLEFNGERKTVSEWTRLLGFSKTLIHDRLSRGWSVADTLTNRGIKYERH